MADPNRTPDGLLLFYENSLEFGRKTQAEHSKWLINTLYLLHSGAIAGILSRVPTEKISPFIAPLTWFVIGLALAFLTALAIWANYRFYIVAYSELIARIRQGQWHAGAQLPKSVKSTNLTELLALMVGLASFACLVVGAITTLGVLKSLSTGQ